VQPPRRCHAASVVVGAAFWRRGRLTISDWTGAAPAVPRRRARRASRTSRRCWASVSSVRRRSDTSMSSNRWWYMVDSIRSDGSWRRYSWVPCCAPLAAARFSIPARSRHRGAPNDRTPVIAAPSGSPASRMGPSVWGAGPRDRKSGRRRRCRSPRVHTTARCADQRLVRSRGGLDEALGAGGRARDHASRGEGTRAAATVDITLEAGRVSADGADATAATRGPVVDALREHRCVV
jgi:hypothetical protein